MQSPFFMRAARWAIRLSERWHVLVSFDHISNGDGCARNQGLNNYGARIGFSF
jgi:Lipid A 3-O-deacylase (PagL)